MVRRGKRQMAITLIARATDRASVLAFKESLGPAKEVLQRFRLTAREVEVVGWLAHGESNKQIARRLGVTFRTIEKHIEHILPKLQVTSRTAACVLATSLLGGITV